MNMFLQWESMLIYTTMNLIERERERERERKEKSKLFILKDKKRKAHQKKFHLLPFPLIVFKHYFTNVWQSPAEWQHQQCPSSGRIKWEQQVSNLTQSIKWDTPPIPNSSQISVLNHNIHLLNKLVSFFPHKPKQKQTNRCTAVYKRDLIPTLLLNPVAKIVWTNNSSLPGHKAVKFTHIEKTDLRDQWREMISTKSYPRTYPPKINAANIWYCQFLHMCMLYSSIFFYITHTQARSLCLKNSHKMTWTLVEVNGIWSAMHITVNLLPWQQLMHYLGRKRQVLTIFYLKEVSHHS